MKKITSREDLNQAIQQLENQKTQDWDLLREQFRQAGDNLKPAHLLANALHEYVSIPGFKGNLINTTLSLTAGYLTKKIMVGSSHNPIKQLLGVVLQMGVASIISKNKEGIQSTAKHFIQQVFNKNGSPVQLAPVDE